MKLWKNYSALIEKNILAQELSEAPGLLYWRDKLFANIIIFLLPVSGIALVPGVIMSIKSGIPGLAVYDTLAVIIFSLVAFVKQMTLRWRKTVLLVCFYLLAIILLLYLGPLGPGLIYLFAITIFSTLIFPVSIGFLTVGANTIITIAFAVVVHSPGIHFPLGTYYDSGSWIAVSSNLAVLSILSVTSLNLLFKGLNRTILKEKEIREDLLQSEILYKQMFYKNPLPMFIFDSKDLRFLLVNKEAVKTYGYTEDEFYNLTILDIRTPEAAERLKAEDVAITDNNYRNFGTSQHLTKSGEVIDVEVQSDEVRFSSRQARMATIVNVTERNKAAKLLSKQKTLLETVSKNFPNGTVAIIDAGYTIKYIDGQELYKTNLLPENLINTNYLEKFCYAEQQQVKDFLQPVFEGNANSAELELSGQTYLYSAVSINDEHRDKTIVIASQNVTEQRLKEKSLTLFETAIINSENGFVVYNLPDSASGLPTFGYVNRAFEKLAGYSSEELIGNPPLILNALGSRMSNVNKLNDAFQQNRELKTELLGKKKNGEEYWTSVHIIPVFNKKGKLINYITLHNDITANKKLEKQREILLYDLAKSEQNVKSLINNTTDLIWSVDRNFKYITFNEALTVMAGHYGATICVGQDALGEGFCFEARKNWEGHYVKALKGEKFSTDIDLIIPAGIRYVGSVSFNPIRNHDGEITGVGCFLKEITQRRIYEEKIENQNEKLKEIAFLTSHSLRAPITNILGLVRVLDLENFSNPQNKELIKYLYTSAMKVDEVIHEIVDQTLLLGSKEVSANLKKFSGKSFYNKR